MANRDVLILAGKEYHRERKYARDRHASKRTMARKRAKGCPYIIYLNEIWLAPVDADPFILKDSMRRRNPAPKARRQRQQPTEKFGTAVE
jgi:hypothetical protein